MATLADHIVRDAEICGGEPRIRGTRITVRAIVEAIRLYHATAPLLHAYPDLIPEDLDAALVYYVEHPGEIERYIHEHRSAEEDTTELPKVLKLSK
ncbi:MAG TPA: DUF433 domain-containing protein [Gammaproteobacteria bacterium]|nr:DUF433 domain-containing protein [Gammaproteobacteria bacterium]